jgi:hypothetical protein
MHGMHSPLSNPQGLSMISRSLERATKTIASLETNPRLMTAKVVDGTRKDEVVGAEHLLRQSPAHPVLVATLKDGGVPELARVAQYPNVRMLKLPSGRELADSLAIFNEPRLSTNENQTREIRIRVQREIRHDLGHALRGSSAYSKEGLLARARAELGLQGPDDEVIARVMSEQPLTRRSQDCNDIGGVFVDWAGTLYNNGAVSQDVFTEATREADALGTSLSVWTGGTVNEVYRILREASIDLHVCSKQDCHGLRVAVAVDDEDPEQLRTAYGLDAHRFIKSI